MLDGIARSHNWISLALMPHSLLRPLLILAMLAAAYVLGYRIDATGAMLVTVIAIWTTALGQLLVLERHLTRTVAPGAKSFDIKGWFATSLPMIAVWGIYTLLTTTDVLVLQQFRPSDEVAHYYAASKTLTLVTFVYFAVAASAGSPLRRAITSPATATGLASFRGADDQMDLLAVARRDAADPRARQADALAVRARASPRPIR